MLFLGIFYCAICLIFTIASVRRSLRDKDYRYRNKAEAVGVWIFLILFCWAVIPAELSYFYMKEDNDKTDFNHS